VSKHYSYPDYLDDPFRATKQLGRLLNRSVLRLFIGAGVSVGFGLPNWQLLIARMLNRETDRKFLRELKAKSGPELGRLVDHLDDGSEGYASLVKTALYSNVKKNLLDELRKSPLLLALAALMTGAQRGRVDSVVTYNFDDLLEQYLEMLGLAVCSRTKPDDLSTRADVEINYVHGRIPQHWNGSGRSPKIILSEKSFRDTRSKIDEGWPAFVLSGLQSKIGLFLALSGDDSGLLDILKRTETRLRRSANYAGYWILTHDAFQRNEGAIRGVKMCPIRIHEDQIPLFIFEICREAASLAAPIGKSPR
jgi:hypothetical protein